MLWSVPTVSTEPDALGLTALWSRGNPITMVITERLFTGVFIALLAYTALVALVLMGQQSSVGPIKPKPISR